MAENVIRVPTTELATVQEIQCGKGTKARKSIMVTPRSTQYGKLGEPLEAQEDGKGEAQDRNGPNITPCYPHQCEPSVAHMVLVGYSASEDARKQGHNMPATNDSVDGKGARTEHGKQMGDTRQNARTFFPRTSEFLR